MVEVFKTDVGTIEQADQVIQLLQTEFNPLRVTVDLEDCDNVLRIESDQSTIIKANSVIVFLAQHQISCEILPD